MARHTAFFRQLDKRSVAQAGGKGANLGELTRAGFPVPPGFVVVASVFDRFLEETDLNVEIDGVLDKLRGTKDVNAIDGASRKIQTLILNRPIPSDIRDEVNAAAGKLNAPFMAVRSSATAEDSKIASWAGELESYLFVTATTLTDSVRKCWASLFTPRALFYRFEKKLHTTKVSVGVVVQKMVNSDVSGVSFSVHPVTQDPDQLIIEAGWGLGEAIVLGKITPDSYVVNKKAETLLDVNVSEQREMIVRKKPAGTATVAVPRAKRNKQKLTGTQIIALARIVKKIERHYGHPQDIEWALEKAKFYVTQTRPITTLK